MKTDRREFLKSVVGAVAGIAACSLLPPTAKKFSKSKVKDWDLEFSRDWDLKFYTVPAKRFWEAEDMDAFLEEIYAESKVWYLENYPELLEDVA